MTENSPPEHDIEWLDHELFHEMDERFRRIDYARLRELMNTMAVAFHPVAEGHWDVPPVDLGAQVRGTLAAKQLLLHLYQANGLLRVVERCSDRLQRVLRPELLPAEDHHLFRSRGQSRQLHQLLEAAKTENHLTSENVQALERLDENALSRRVQVNVADPGRWDERPIPRPEDRPARLSAMLQMSQIISGGLLVAVDTTLGLFTVLHMGPPNAYVALAMSIYAGANGVLAAVLGKQITQPSPAVPPPAPAKMATSGSGDEVLPPKRASRSLPPKKTSRSLPSKKKKKKKTTTKPAKSSVRKKRPSKGP